MVIYIPYLYTYTYHTTYTQVIYLQFKAVYSLETGEIPFITLPNQNRISFVNLSD